MSKTIHSAKVQEEIWILFLLVALESSAASGLVCHKGGFDVQVKLQQQVQKAVLSSKHLPSANSDKRTRAAACEQIRRQLT